MTINIFLCIFTKLQVIFNLLLPASGVFFFTIFVCNLKFEDTFSSVLSLRVNCLQVREKPFCRFPSLPDGYGPTPLAEKLGIKADGCDEYYIVSNEGKVILDLKFSVPVFVSHSLIEGEGEREYDRYVFPRHCTDKSVSYLFRLPHRGIYVFSLFCARKCNSTLSGTLQCVCRYLIQSNFAASSSTLNIRPFPKYHVHWINSKLREPVNGDLSTNRNVRFKLEVSNATSVAVQVGQQWYYLEYDSGLELWEGVVYTGTNFANAVTVCASYQTGTKKKFLPLLEYKLRHD